MKKFFQKNNKFKDCQEKIEQYDQNYFKVNCYVSIIIDQLLTYNKCIHHPSILDNNVSKTYTEMSSIVKLLFDHLCAQIIEMNILETPCETLVVLN